MPDCTISRRKALAGFLGLAFILGCEDRKVIPPPPSAQALASESILITDVMRNPDAVKRQQFITDFAKENGWDKFATWDYCIDMEDCAKLSLQYGVNSLASEIIMKDNDLDNATVNIVPVRLTLAELTKQYGESAQEVGHVRALTVPHDVSKLGTGQKAHVYVLASMFEFDRDKEISEGNLRRIKSTLYHESVHALDYYAGIDLGDNLVLNGRTYFFFSRTGAISPLIEFRASGATVVYEGKFTDGKNFVRSTTNSYAKQYSACKLFLEKNPYPKVGGVRINETIERQIEMHQKDPLLRRFYNK